MKKKLFLVFIAILLCFTLVGCEDKEVKESEWELNMKETEVIYSDEVKEVFEKATLNYEEKLKPVALLGEQVVAGTNYMFLCRSGDAFKTVIIYKDLEGNAEVTKVNNFDASKYINKNKSINAATAIGGWTTNIPEETGKLEKRVQDAFDQAMESVIGVSYYPVEILAHQEFEGDNYAILCYGRVSDQSGTTGVFIVTLKIEENGHSVALSISAIDIREYNM